MTAWSRYLFGASMTFGWGVLLLAEQLPAWLGPVSIFVMVLAASAFLTCSVLEHWCRRRAVGTVEQ
ncbi:hypothetical protein [Janibacter alittae]|uniref:Uncharacterized protein n=1 Tax=Janibacter alittae TaxID=3115209 RepID=A0ABZ2MIG5_9MICO